MILDQLPEGRSRFDLLLIGDDKIHANVFQALSTVCLQEISVTIIMITIAISIILIILWITLLAFHPYMVGIIFGSAPDQPAPGPWLVRRDLQSLYLGYFSLWKPLQTCMIWFQIFSFFLRS